jgi:putative FmdB family regulatory protein
MAEIYGRCSMPAYDYVCNDCHKTFERVLTLHEHDSQQMMPALRRPEPRAEGSGVLSRDFQKKRVAR